MFDYKGKKCLSCGEEFSSADDIVVCPECGTPYHRSCYENEKHCINDTLHASGESWIQVEKRNEESVCRMCGTHNEPYSLACKRCGRSLSLVGTTKDPKMNTPPPPPLVQMRTQVNDRYLGMNPDEDFEGVKLSEIADYVGKNTWYYLPIFKQMKLTGKKVSFNFPAIIFKSFYFANRKMRVPAYLSLFILSLLSTPNLLIYFAEDMPGSFGELKNIIDVENSLVALLIQLASFIYYGVLFIMCFFSNWIYYRHIIKHIKRIKSNAISPEKCAQEIRLAGGTSLTEVFAAIIVQIALVFLTLVITNFLLNGQ